MGFGCVILVTMKEAGSSYSPEVLDNIRLHEIARITIVDIKQIADSLKKNRNGFTEKPKEPLSGAKANFKLLKNDISVSLEKFCVCLINEDKELFQVDFTSGSKFFRFFSPKPFIRFNGMKLEFIEPNPNIAEEHNKQEIRDAKMLENLWNRGKASKEAIVRLGELSGEETVSIVIRALDRYSGTK